MQHALQLPLALISLAAIGQAAPQIARHVSPELDPRTPITQKTSPGDADSIFRITKPGSYYLTGNLVGESGKAGIEIASGNVQLDLMGFRMRGGAGTLDGIVVSTPGVYTVEIRNANLTGWGGDGIDLDLVTSGSVVRQAVSSGNGGAGVRVGDDAIVEDSATSGNTGPGVHAGNHARVRRTRANQNDIGILTGDRAELVGCTTNGNTQSGTSTNERSRVVDCTSSSNGQNGFYAYDGSNYLRCHAENNGFGGIQTTNKGGVVDQCFLGGNSWGVSLTGEGTVANCEIVSNTAGGIQSSGLIRDNRISGGTVGINVSSNSRIVGNHVTGCSSDGIKVRSGGSLVMDNTVTFCQTIGIRLEGQRSTLIRNVASNNPIDYYVPAGNKAGPIITADGFSPTTDPWANFSS